MWIGKTLQINIQRKLRNIYQRTIIDRTTIIVILAILIVATDVKYTQAVEYNFEYIENDIETAKGYIEEVNKNGLSEKVRGIEGYTNSPKEAGYSEYELRSKGDARVKGEDKDENEGVREAIGAAKSSYVENPHRSNYTVGKLQHKEFIKKSDAVTRNTISGLNAEGETECKIADKDLGGENVEFEEYYVDVEDTRLVKKENKCEEDEDRLFYCERSIKSIGECEDRMDCGYNASGIKIKSIAVESASVSMKGAFKGNKRIGSLDVSWKYNYPILKLGPPYKAWEGWIYLVHCATQCCDMTMKSSIDLKDTEEIKSFKLKKVPAGVFIDIRVNGHLAYNSLGGNKLEVKRENVKHTRYRGGMEIGSNYKVDGGNGKVESCLLNWGNHEQAPISKNIEMKKYLVEGKNSIEIKIAWSGMGSNDPFISIEAKQACCKKWGNDEWEGDCPL